MANRLRVSVIGAGAWAAAAHLPALAARPEVELFGICSRSQQSLRKLRDTYGFVVSSENYQDVLAEGVDIAVVASPAGLHKEHVAAAMHAGAHVLCEKPMTISPRDAWDLVRLARDLDRQLLLGFGWNYMPLIRSAKQLVEERGIGRLEHLAVYMSSCTRELLSGGGTYAKASSANPPESATWTNAALSGGGYGQAQLTHALGVALHLVPDRVAEAFALVSPSPAAGVELHDAIALRFDSGAIGSISGGSSHSGVRGSKHQLDIRAIGSEGQLIVDLHRELIWLARRDSGEVALEIEPGAGAYDGLAPANALVDVALGLAANNCAPGELGARTTEALALAYRSVNSHRPEGRTW